MSKIIILCAVTAALICVVSARRVRLGGDWSEEKKPELDFWLMFEESISGIIDLSKEKYIHWWPIAYKERVRSNGDKDYLVRVEVWKEMSTENLYMLAKIMRPASGKPIVEKILENVSENAQLSEFRSGKRCYI